MPLSLLDKTVDLFFLFADKAKTDELKRIEKFDQLLIWILGLSTGALFLILSNVDRLSSWTTKFQFEMRFISLLLICAVVSGILSRILLFYFSHKQFELYLEVESEMRDLTTPQLNRVLKGTESSELIYAYLLNDLKLDMPYILNLKKFENKSEWDKIDEHARDIYKAYQKHMKAEQSVMHSEIYRRVSVLVAGSGLLNDYEDAKARKKRRKKTLLQWKLIKPFEQLATVFFATSFISFGVALLTIGLKLLPIIFKTT